VIALEYHNSRHDVEPTPTTKEQIERTPSWRGQLETKCYSCTREKHPCIPSLNVVLVSVEFSENLPFHAYNVFVDQLKHCLGSTFDGSLSSTVLLKTRGNKFVIHRAVCPPMQAEYHLIDLHPAGSLNDAHGVRVVCFHVISLARLIHRI
jgi:hypothetical protein